MNNILEVTNLCKHYNEFKLDNISFSLPTGCITGFIGINGAGKTTTLRSILGLAGKVNGDIIFDNENVKGRESWFKDQIGVVFDDNYFYPDLTMKEMKSIIAPAYSAWDDNAYRKYMSQFNLNESHKISSLSKGMKMKFSLVMALSHNARLLIMDEPTSGLDPLVRSEFLDILQEYMSDGTRSAFFSTHITSDLDKIADVLILIDDGKIIFEKDKDALIERHRIVKGKLEDLSDAVKAELMSIHRTEYNFTAITSDHKRIRSLLPNAVYEIPTVEDIMLSYIDRPGRRPSND